LRRNVDHVKTYRNYLSSGIERLVRPHLKGDQLRIRAVERERERERTGQNSAGTLDFSDAGGER
jgi:hypothetical protein